VVPGGVRGSDSPELKELGPTLGPQTGYGSTTLFTWAVLDGWISSFHRLELEIRGGDSIVSRLQSHAGASVASVVAEFDKVI
jgi:hypothetical protein